MRIRWSVLALSLMLCLGAMRAKAQIAVYGEFTGVNTGIPNTPHLYGGTFGAYMTKRFGVVALGPDFRGIIAHRSATGSTPDQAMDDGLAGLRLSLAPRVLPIMPYLEAVGGVGYERTGQGPSRSDKFSAATQFLAGVDYTIVPRFDWRVIEFSYGRLGNGIGIYNPKTLSTGIVFRLP